MAMRSRFARPAIREYLRVAAWDFLAAMSGVASVPFAALAVFSDADSARTIWLVMAAVMLMFAGYRVWAVERKRVIELEERIRPKIKCSFSKTIPGCVIPKSRFFGRDGYGNTHELPLITLLRICVEADCVGSVSECNGKLISIRRGWTTIFKGDNLSLTFAPADRENPQSKEIRDQTPEYLDLLAITHENKIMIATQNFVVPTWVDLATMFSEHGEYIFEVVVSSPQTKAVKVNILMRWAGDFQTADFELEPQPA
jgi:hypothetical protein